MTDRVTPARQTAAVSPDAERLRTLLVDDHASVLRFLALVFSSDGCDVTTAARAEEAIELIGKSSFDLVVSDIKMPGLSGLDLLQTVKDQQPATPVVLITGAPSVESAVFGLRHQAYDYLVKPFSAEQIQELLRRVRVDRQHLKAQEEPAGQTEELARRQLGMEMLSRIGSLAFQGLDCAAFVDKALAQVVETLDRPRGGHPAVRRRPARHADPEGRPGAGRPAHDHGPEVVRRSAAGRRGRGPRSDDHHRAARRPRDPDPRRPASPPASCA